MFERSKGHRWQPIADLPGELQSRGFPELDALLAVFEARRGEIEGAGALREFQARMIRSWSIETGILESLYTLSEIATLTMLEQGFDAALLTHGDTNVRPEDLVAILRDHQQAAEGLFGFVRGGRPLSTSYVRELHQSLVRHQDVCDARDPRGILVHVPLLKGEWKVQPNNPGDAKTGEVWHEYCPPEQVASEMDRLIAMHARHSDVHYLVIAAWLHHRFTQIHPFQDGNGRVARALASLVSIRAHGFPVVVTRAQRDPYIRSLQQADRGDLGPLVALFERQQREAFTKALGLSYQAVEDTQNIDAILADAKRRLQSSQSEEWNGLSSHVATLTRAAIQSMESTALAINAQLGPEVKATVAQSGGSDARRFGTQVAEAAEWYGYAANVAGPRSWVMLRLEHKGASNLVIAFHHVGPVEYGVVSATAFLTLTEDVRAAAAIATSLAPVEFVCDRPFTFTASRDTKELLQSFGGWMEQALTRGLDIWRRGL